MAHVIQNVKYTEMLNSNFIKNSCAAINSMRVYTSQIGAFSALTCL